MKRIMTTTALMACVVASAFMALGPATAHATTHGTAGIRIPLAIGTALSSRTATDARSSFG